MLARGASFLTKRFNYDVLGGTMSSHGNVSNQKIGLIKLILRMLSPKTLPHIISIAVISSILMLFVSRFENFVALAFISLSISYLIIAIFSNNDLIINLVTIKTNDNEKFSLNLLISGFKIIILPLVIAFIIFILAWNITGGSDNSFIPPSLAMLFVAWSIGQAISFRSGMVEWLENGLGDAKLHTYREKLSTVSQVIIVQTFALILIWVGQLSSDSGSGFLNYLINGSTFMIVSISLQILTLWLTRHQREAAGAEKGLAGFSFKWMIIAQLFITWHTFSIYRRYFLEPSVVSTLIEEVTLMSVTVFFAVWSLTTYTVSEGKRLVSDNAALPIAISFGYAYAGSVSMLSGTFGSIDEVLMFGHFLTIVTIILICNSTIKNSRKSSLSLQKAKTTSINIEKTGNQDLLENVVKNDSDSWQEEESVDWRSGDDIGDGTIWSDEDVEVVD